MSRIEKILAALLRGETVDFEPESRAEQYLKNCIEACGCTGLPTPVTRLDALLYALADKMAGGTGGGEALDSLIGRTLTSISNDTATKIGGYAVSYCTSLVSASFSKVKTIDNYAFCYDYDLESVSLPVCESIGVGVFYYCTSLKTVDFSGCTVVPTLEDKNTFYNVPTTCEVIIPDVLYDEWIAAENWADVSVVYVRESEKVA